MLSRRDLVGRIAAGVAGACVLGVGKASWASVRYDADQGAPEPTTYGPPTAATAEVPATKAAPAPWNLVHPLALGSMVAHGWRVADLTGVVDGSCVLTLENQRGRAHRVHICRNDGQPQGLVYTQRFDLVVMNGGQGDLPTEEGFAQAIAQIAHVLAANEHDSRQAPIVTAMLPHGERIRRFTGAEDHRLR